MLSVFFFKQKTAYEMRISDWSSDVCSSDLLLRWGQFEAAERLARNVESLGVQFNAFERNPGEVLARVAQARGAAGAQQSQGPAAQGNPMNQGNTNQGDRKSVE